MVGEPIADRRALRHQASRREILEAAWSLIRDKGVAGLSLGDLGRAVGMRPQSLYSYFPSKHAIYDALFAQGFEALIAERRALRLSRSPEKALRQGSHHFIEFCVADPTRCQLLFQSSVPGFHPTEESLSLSFEALSFGQRWLDAAGCTDPSSLDLWRAVLVGLAGEQIANQPGGDRWTGLVDRMLDAFLIVTRRSHA
jgi:AcrR family transcriptional regulator